MRHYPVMLKDVVRSIRELRLKRKIRVADCNFGLGGHSNAILKEFPNSYITGYEVDPTIYDKYQEDLSLHTGDQSRLTVLMKNFNKIAEECSDRDKFDIVLGDLGYNSLQLEEKDGFSWKRDSPLDMRYSQDSMKCSDLINNLTSTEISEIMNKFGDLSLIESRSVGLKIINNRPIKTTFQLRDCVLDCFQQEKTKKLAQVFQGFRICVNSELQNLRTLCNSLDKVLNVNGLALIITFHSLERDVIRRELRESNNFSKIITEIPKKTQLEENSRSKSAKMLSFRKVR